MASSEVKGTPAHTHCDWCLIKIKGTPVVAVVGDKQGICCSSDCADVWLVMNEGVDN